MTAERYDTVLVHEPGIKPWRGSVQAIKPPRPENRKGKKLDQWADVRREDGIELVVPLSYLEVLEAEPDPYADPFHGERNEDDAAALDRAVEVDESLRQAREDYREALDKLADR